MIVMILTRPRPSSGGDGETVTVPARHPETGRAIAAAADSPQEALLSADTEAVAKLRATGAVWTVTRHEIEKRAGRAITDTEARRIASAISNSTIWECIGAAIEQVCGWPEEQEDEDQFTETAGVQHAPDVRQAGTGLRYAAHFTPEAWVNNQAIEVDPEGPATWDCTEYARQNQDYLDRLKDHSEPLDSPHGAVDNDDKFKEDPAAPQWVRDWRGPFTIRITQHESASPARRRNITAPEAALVPADDEHGQGEARS